MAFLVALAEFGSVWANIGMEVALIIKLTSATVLARLNSLFVNGITFLLAVVPRSINSVVIRPESQAH